MSARKGTCLDGRYLLGDRIAVGGMGEVWRGSDKVLGRTVAVKILRAELAEDQAFRKRFRAEARTAGGLPHNGIAQVFDYGETTVGPDGESPSKTPVQGDGIAYLVMELVPGEPLSATLHRDGALGSERTLAYVAQAAHALHAAHLRGVIHRDVKPANLMVTPEGRIKVTDFGIARPLDHDPVTMTGQVMGTAHYLAPELARGLVASPLSDVYALGVVAYECLAGHRPFEGENQVLVATAHLNQQPPPLPGTVPPDVVRVVAAAMEKEPEARISSAEAFAVALDKLAAGDPSALDDIGGSGSGIRGAQAPTFGPDGGLVGGVPGRGGRHSSAPAVPVPGSGTDQTTRLTGPPGASRPPGDGRTRWTSPQTAPQGYPAAQSGYGTGGYESGGYGTGGYDADGRESSPGGPGRFGPGYSFGPTPSERRRERSIFSPTLILMLSLLALIIVLIFVLNRIGITGGIVDLVERPTPTPTPSVSQPGVVPSASTPSTRATASATRTTTAAPTRSASPTTRPSSATTAPSSTPPSTAPTSTPPSTTTSTTPTESTQPSTSTTPPSPSDTEPVSVSPSVSVPGPGLPGLGLPALALVRWHRRHRRRRHPGDTAGHDASGATWPEAGAQGAARGWTMSGRNEQGRNA